jgi:hypothetical protein
MLRVIFPSGMLLMIINPAALLIEPIFKGVTIKLAPITAVLSSWFKIFKVNVFCAEAKNEVTISNRDKKHLSIVLQK